MDRCWCCGSSCLTECGNDHLCRIVDLAVCEEGVILLLVQDLGWGRGWVVETAELEIAATHPVIFVQPKSNLIFQAIVTFLARD